MICGLNVNNFAWYTCFTFTRKWIGFSAFFLFGRNGVQGRRCGPVFLFRRHKIARINTPDGGAPKKQSLHLDHSKSPPKTYVGVCSSNLLATR